MYLTVCPFRGPTQLPPLAECFKYFDLADHILPARPESVWEKMAQYISATGGGGSKVANEHILMPVLGLD